MGIPVIQPQRLTEHEAMTQLQNWSPELIVVAAFGQILKPDLLNLPRHGCLNVHASLLPRWRGAAPIQAAILHGDEKTGTTIMRMDPGLDTGPIISQSEISIKPDETAGSLSNRLAELGAGLLIETLPAYLEGHIHPKPQDDSLATYAPMLKKAEGQLDFSQPADELARRVRAFNPWPGIFMNWGKNRIKIHRARSEKTSSADVGMTVIHTGLPAVLTGDGLLVLEEVQPAGKKAMPGDVFLRGARGWGER
jgi:methionyl-tRNA formyltransferase